MFGGYPVRPALFQRGKSGESGGEGMWMGNRKDRGKGNFSWDVLKIQKEKQDFGKQIKLEMD